jgi:soluble lytic murein transglycosylase
MGRNIGLRAMFLAVLIHLYGLALAFDARAQARATDIDALQTAFERADRGDWDEARDAVSAASPLAAKLVEWRYYSSSPPGEPFDRIERFLKASPKWPGRPLLLASAENALWRDGLSPAAVQFWFAGRTPQSAAGVLALAEAQRALGQADEATETIRVAWRTGRLDVASYRRWASNSGTSLSAGDHAARLDALLWARNHSAAEAMESYLSGPEKATMRARIRLQTGARDAERAYRAVTGAHAASAGLLFDRAAWLRKRGRSQEAAGILLRASRALTAFAPSVPVWWQERNIAVRKSLDDGNAEQAYLLASDHKIAPAKDLTSYVDAEFLAGWIALRRLNRAEAARAHFANITNVARAPVSVSRGHYWLGRAYAALNNKTRSQQAFEAAAKFSLTYYGHLALTALRPNARVSIPVSIPVPSNGPVTSEEPDAELLEAVALLHGIGDRRRMSVFANAAAEACKSASCYRTLSARLRAMGEPGLSVRAAKKAIADGHMSFDEAFPRLALPMAGNLEAAFAKAIIRQESEFDARAESSARARGLMQLMASTAKMTAIRHGISYDRPDDLFDPDKNVRLGTAHLQDLLDDWGGSYVLTAVAYNAGPGRAKEWIARFGDPRAKGADVIDWVEQIPFNETRNYVMRVLENVQVYRAIAQNGQAPLKLSADLRRGEVALAVTATAKP